MSTELFFSVATIFKEGLPPKRESAGPCHAVLSQHCADKIKKTIIYFFIIFLYVGLNIGN